MVYVRILYVFATVAGLALAGVGCARDADEAPLASGGSHHAAAPGESPLSRFCGAGAAACEEVTEAECADIVIDAEKFVSSADVPCAERASDCDDTAACLDALQVVPVVDGGDMPTTQPAT